MKKNILEAPRADMDEVAYCRSCNRTVHIEMRVGEHYVERLPDGSKRWHPVVDCDAGVLH